VNSGGVSLITGDVTTLMIFLADKVEILTLLTLAIPASITVFILAVFLSGGLSGTVTLQASSNEVRKVDVIIAILFLATIIGTISGNALFGIPPVLTFLFGLSIMFLVSRFMSSDEDLDPILEYIRVIEFETLLFFLGILLLVGMLKEIHALDSLVAIYDVLPPVYANYLMGIFSAIIDNVPLTAALLKSGIDMSPAEWMGLTYAVGVGGSLLVIGSAAGNSPLAPTCATPFTCWLPIRWAMAGCCYSDPLLTAEHEKARGKRLPAGFEPLGAGLEIDLHADAQAVHGYIVIIVVTHVLQVRGQVRGEGEVDASAVREVGIVILNIAGLGLDAGETQYTIWRNRALVHHVKGGVAAKEVIQLHIDTTNGIVINTKARARFQAKVFGGHHTHFARQRANIGITNTVKICVHKGVISTRIQTANARFVHILGRRGASHGDAGSSHRRNQNILLDSHSVSPW